MNTLFLHHLKLKQFGALVLAVVVLAGTALATHFRYGHISWRPVGTNGEVEISVTAAFRNGYGVTAIGQYFSETIGGTGLFLGDGTVVGSMDWHVVGFQDGTQIVIAKLDPGRTGADIVRHTYGGPGTYTVTLESCCRISGPAHINNPDGYYRLATPVTPSFTTWGNSSPVSSSPAIVNFFQNEVNTFPLPAIDPNGDPLNFRLATGLEASGFAGGFIQPGAPFAPNPLTVGGATGLISWDTTGAQLNAAGETLYSCQIIIEDGTTQVPLDLLFRLVPRGTNNCPVFEPPTPPNNSVLQTNLGSTLRFDVQASDLDLMDTVTLNPLGAPSGSVFTQTPGNPATGAFSWSTSRVGDFIVTIQAIDNLGCTANTAVILRVLPPLPCGWDLGADWSDVHNPNGPWSLNAGATPLPINDPNWNGSGNPGWRTALGLPIWMKVVKFSPSLLGPDAPPGSVTMHSDDTGNGTGVHPANVTWTSPVSGTFALTGAVWFTDAHPGRSALWFLSLDGQPLDQGYLSDGDPWSSKDPRAFSHMITVQPGSVLKLEFDRRLPNDPGTFCGVRLTINDGLVLWGPFEGLAGASNDFQIRGATSGGRIYLAYSMASGSDLVPGCTISSCLSSPQLVTSAVANAAGQATITRTIPAAATGLTVYFQAAEPKNCRVSNLVVHTFP